MFHQVVAGLKALLILWIGIFACQIVKIPVLSWIKGPESALAGVVLPQGATLETAQIKNPFLPTSFSTSLLASKAIPTNWILKGTLLLGEESKVVLENAQTGSQLMLAEGEEFQGTRVVQIARNQVELENRLGHVTLSLDASLRQKKSAVQFAATVKEPIKKREVARQVVEVKKKTLDKLVRKIPELVKSFELILFEGYPPSPTGYLIAAGPQLMQMDPMGLEDGDVIKKIDGRNLRSEKDLFEVFQNLSSKKEIEIEVDRYQKEMVITYHVQS